MEKNKALSAKQQSIVPIAAFTANGDMQNENLTPLFFHFIFDNFQYHINIFQIFKTIKR